MALQLRQIEIRPGAARLQCGVVVEQVQAEVDERAGHRLAVDQQVLLVEVPAARAHQQRGDLRIEAVLLAVGIRERNLAGHGIAQVDLPLHDVVPGRRERVLAVRHENFRARVQRVDHHLAIGRAGDLDAPVLQVGGNARDAPLRLAHFGGLGQEIGEHAIVQALLQGRARRQQLDDAIAEAPRQVGYELQGGRRQHGFIARLHRAADCRLILRSPSLLLPHDARSARVFAQRRMPRYGSGGQDDSFFRGAGKIYDELEIDI